MLVAAFTPELAYAIARALALDPRDRYESAREMGRAISDGALGIAPVQPTRTRAAAPATEATSVLTAATRAQQPAAKRSGAVVPRQPRRGPSREPAPRPIAATATPRRTSGARRLTTAIVALLALVGIIALIVVLSSPAQTKITLRNVVYSDAQESAEALKQLVGENTK
jgi:hypothetical protein